MFEAEISWRRSLISHGEILLTELNDNQCSNINLPSQSMYDMHRYG